MEFCNCYTSATIWATALSAPTLVARTHSVPSVLMVAPTTALPGILLSVFQQLVGIDVVSSYSTSLWRSVGLPESDSLTITRLTSVTNVLVTLIGVESHEVDGGDGLGLHIPADSRGGTTPSRREAEVRAQRLRHLAAEMSLCSAEIVAQERGLVPRTDRVDGRTAEAGR